MPNTTPNLGLIKPLLTEQYDIAKVTNDNADILDSEIQAVKDDVLDKQDTLVSGTNIKSVNGSSILSSGDLELLPKNNPISTGVHDLQGGQIKFPAIQNPSGNANTLDDYEEGSFTPVASCDSGTITTYTASAIYTKIGREVTVHFSITISDKGTGAGGLNIGVLPFIALSGRNYIGYGRVDGTTGKMCQGSLLSGGSTISIKDYDNLTVIATGAVISFTITYQS